MEMGRSGNGGGKVVSFDDAISGSGSGRRRNSSSLSSYLDMGRDADGGRATPRPPLPMASRRRTYADGELDVFSAERYFKGAMDGDGDQRKEGFSVTTTAVAVQVQQPLVETATAAARPTAEAVVMAKPSSTRASTAASSAASSANSQTALVRGRRRSSRDNRCCVQVSMLMRTCSGKRSVRVDGCEAAKEAPDVAAEPAAATGIHWYRELRMHKGALGLSGDVGNSHGRVAAGLGLPPSLNLGTAKVAAVGRKVATGDEKEAADLTFSSSINRRSNFTLVAPVRAANVPVSGRGVGEPGGGAGKAVGRGGGAHHLHDNDDDDNDSGSESSSDLFEIKSLMIGDCPYEPSEASIQWSVVTADAASERGDRVPARWIGSSGVGGARGPVAGSRQLRGHNRPAGILAGCASHRAVDVSAATTTMKAVPNATAAMQQQRRSERFHKARNGA